MAKPHTHEKKTFALKTLRENNMNFTKTARETGVTKTTLLKWHRTQQNNDTFPPEQITPEIVKETLLKRIYQLADITTDIEKIVKALNIICQNYPVKKEEEGPNLYDRINWIMSGQEQ